MSHCVNVMCKKCKTTFCARGCSDTCACGEEVEYTEEEKEEMRRKLQELYESLPGGWF